jgi:ataxia telangiectasia mutated family protein
MSDKASTHSPQGKLLRIPERVPFRMTRDMVDGMGKCGTQGVFQRCAEETLRVLRDRSDVILTVLEVFKHDPLHSWYVRSSLPTFNVD